MGDRRSLNWQMLVQGDSYLEGEDSKRHSYQDGVGDDSGDRQLSGGEVILGTDSSLREQ